MQRTLHSTRLRTALFKRKHLPTISNVCFLVPFLIALYFELYVGAALTGTLLVSSTLYHLTLRKEFIFTDKVLSYGSICFNLYLCDLFGFFNWYFLCALFFLVVALFAYTKGTSQRNYDYYHSLWHVASAGITTCCYLGFVHLAQVSVF